MGFLSIIRVYIPVVVKRQKPVFTSIVVLVVVIVVRSDVLPHPSDETVLRKA